MVKMNRGINRGLFPAPVPEPPEQRGAFAAIAIGLVGMLVLGLLGIGAIVILNRAGGQNQMSATAAWLEAAGSHLGRASGALPAGPDALNLLALTVLASVLIAALVGYIVARAAGRSTRKRLDTLERQAWRSTVEMGAVPVGDERELDELREQLETRNDQRMDALEAKMMATLRSWMDDISRSRK